MGFKVYLLLHFGNIKNMHYIDSHAHLTSSAYGHVEAMLAHAQEAGLIAIVNICTDPESLERGIALRQRYPWVYNVAATTPHDVEKRGKRTLHSWPAMPGQAILSQSVKPAWTITTSIPRAEPSNIF